MKKKYKEIDKLSLNIMNTASILSEYCKNQTDNEDMIKIYPIINFIYSTADTLCLRIYEFEKEFINKNAP